MQTDAPIPVATTPTLQLLYTSLVEIGAPRDFWGSLLTTWTIIIPLSASPLYPLPQYHLGYR